MSAETLQTRFIEKGWKLALAESITGGAISAEIVKVAGCSEYFLGSIVAYSNEAKEALLEVGSISLEGAVSQKVASEMARGALLAFPADFALAITGFADQGLAWIAIANQDKIFTSQFRVAGDRQIVIQECVKAALNSLLQFTDPL